MFNELAEEIHKTTRSKGFWATDRNKLEVLMLITTEVAEAAECIREGMPVNKTEFTSNDGQVVSHYQGGLTNKPIGVPSEMADIIIRVLDACAAWGIDIDRIMEEKMHYNKTRPYKHGKTT